MKFSNGVVAVIYKLPTSLSRRALYMYYFRQFPNIRNPETFSEKINWRIIKDRRPLLEWTCDKLAMKDYAEGLRPAKELGLRVPRTLWSGTGLDDLASVELPEHWVLKPNHRSGQIYFGQGHPDVAKLEMASRRWLYPFEAKNLHEWAYLKARRLLLAEELLGVPGSPPSDYKFFVFAGEVAAVQVDGDRHTAHRRRMYLPDWSPIDAPSGEHPLLPAEPEPANLDRMMAIASELGRPFDFIRVDLYSIGDDIFFGELTPYAGSGLEAIRPASLNAHLGTKWKLPGLS